MTPAQKKEVERYLVGQGVVRGGAAQYGGFLGMSTFGYRLSQKDTRERLANSTTTSTSTTLLRPPPPKGRGMQVRPPPFFGTWDNYKRIEFKDTPLSNIDLRKWCDFLRIPIKGIFSRNEPKPLSHSPCIINLDDFGNLGTHWVCCWRSKNGTYEYFDSFGLPPPLEWEKETLMHRKKHFC